MRRELLINATPPETRVAATEDGKTVEVLHERRGHQGLVGNVRSEEHTSELQSR